MILYWQNIIKGKLVIKQGFFQTKEIYICLRTLFEQHETFSLFYNDFINGKYWDQKDIVGRVSIFER